MSVCDSTGSYVLFKAGSGNPTRTWTRSETSGTNVCAPLKAEKLKYMILKNPPATVIGPPPSNLKVIPGKVPENSIKIGRVYYAIDLCIFTALKASLALNPVTTVAALKARIAEVRIQVDEPAPLGVQLADVALSQYKTRYKYGEGTNISIESNTTIFGNKFTLGRAFDATFVQLNVRYENFINGLAPGIDVMYAKAQFIFSKKNDGCSQSATTDDLFPGGDADRVGALVLSLLSARTFEANNLLKIYYPITGSVSLNTNDSVTRNVILIDLRQTFSVSTHPLQSYVTELVSANSDFVMIPYETTLEQIDNIGTKQGIGVNISGKLTVISTGFIDYYVKILRSASGGFGTPLTRITILNNIMTIEATFFASNLAGIKYLLMDYIVSEATYLRSLGVSYIQLAVEKPDEVFFGTVELLRLGPDRDSIYLNTGSYTIWTEVVRGTMGILITYAPGTIVPFYISLPTNANSPSLDTTTASLIVDDGTLASYAVKGVLLNYPTSQGILNYSFTPNCTALVLTRGSTLVSITDGGGNGLNAITIPGFDLSGVVRIILFGQSVSASYFRQLYVSKAIIGASFTAQVSLVSVDPSESRYKLEFINYNNNPYTSTIYQRSEYQVVVKLNYLILKLNIPSFPSSTSENVVATLTSVDGNLYTFTSNFPFQNYPGSNAPLNCYIEDDGA